MCYFHCKSFKFRGVKNFAKFCGSKNKIVTPILKFRGWKKNLVTPILVTPLRRYSLYAVMTIINNPKTLHFGGNTDVSCQIVLQEEFVEEPHTVRGEQLQWYSHETLLNFRIKLDQETNFSFEK